MIKDKRNGLRVMGRQGCNTYKTANGAACRQVYRLGAQGSFDIVFTDSFSQGKALEYFCMTKSLNDVRCLYVSEYINEMKRNA
ncbi:hypothetical protein Syun_021548 [Stephania yunnanensis]|uniref:Uncharacterized protein n=1 Tax=Stephania yunnanensis TaxID=152371 RepID=A0AAP0IH99_9MAGN